MRMLIVAVALVVGASAASAQQASRQCGPYTEVRKMLKNKYHEVPRVVGLSRARTILQILASENGEWTLVDVHPSGLACFVTSGINLYILPKAKPKVPTLKP